MNEEVSVSGWWVFAGVLLVVAGVLNIIWGIAAIGDAKFFTSHGTFIICEPQLLGLDQPAARDPRADRRLLAVLGRRVRALVRDLRRLRFNAVSALLSIPAYPFWSLAIFALSIIIVYKLAEGPEGEVA